MYSGSNKRQQMQVPPCRSPINNRNYQQMVDGIALQVGGLGSIALSSGSPPVMFRTPSRTNSREQLRSPRPTSPNSRMSAVRLDFAATATQPMQDKPGRRKSILLTEKQSQSVQNGLAALANFLGGTNLQPFTEQPRRQEPQQQAPSSMRGGYQNVQYQERDRRDSVQSDQRPVMGFRSPSGTLILSASFEQLIAGGGSSGGESRAKTRSPTSSRPMSPSRARHHRSSRTEVTGTVVTDTDGQRMFVESKTPIVVSQPLSRSTGLAPQMNDLLTNGINGYTASVVVILTPEEKSSK